MAVVKTNYVKQGGGERARAKATIRYNSERPGKEREKITRELFGSDGPLSKEQVYRMIDTAAEGTLFYRFVISPDPRREDLRRDLDLRELTLQTIERLEEKTDSRILFAAVEHNDHAPHRHVHVLALLPRKLTRGDIDHLRASATALSRRQRLLRDLARERRHALSARVYPTRPQPRQRRMAPLFHRASHLKPQRSCPSCSEGQGSPMQKISSRLHKCPSCGIVLRDTGIGLQTELSTYYFSRFLYE